MSYNSKGPVGVTSVGILLAAISTYVCHCSAYMMSRLSKAVSDEL